MGTGPQGLWHLRLGRFFPDAVLSSLLQLLTLALLGAGAGLGSVTLGVNFVPLLATKMTQNVWISHSFPPL